MDNLQKETMVAGPGTDIYVVDMPGREVNPTKHLGSKCSGPFLVHSLPLNVNDWLLLGCCWCFFCRDYGCWLLFVCSDLSPYPS